MCPVAPQRLSAWDRPFAAARQLPPPLPVIKANDQEVAHAISVVFLFNVLAALIFPTLGDAIGMTNDGSACSAGTAVNDTSSVTAAAAVWDGMHEGAQCARLRHHRETHANLGNYSHHVRAGTLRFRAKKKTAGANGQPTQKMVLV